MHSSLKNLFSPFFILILIFFSWYNTLYSQTLRINEVMASNRDVISDEDGSFEDWIEIFNYGDEPINLEGMGLSDNYMKPFKWAMPEYTLQPGEYLLIWASGKDRKPIPHDMQNGIQRLYYPGIPGTSVNNLINHPCFPDNPTSRNVVISHFEAPTNIADNYGQHMYTWITAPATGNYTFWIASDDNSKLYLSTDASEENAVLIAQVPGWTEPRQWHKYAQQQSGQISLQQGQQYYLSALMKEGEGGDNLAVRWLMPDYTLEEPISISHCFIPSARWHTNFRISSEGEELILTAPDGQMLDSMPPLPIPTNRSMGRTEDGGNQWFYFENPTPELANPDAGFSGRAEKPVIFPAAGIYNKAVEVSISSPQTDAKIYYTLDGSRPGVHNGSLYLSPITVSNTNLFRAVAVVPNSMESEIAAATFSVTHDDIKDFSSNIPVMIIHELGTSVSPGERTTAYMTLLDDTSGERIQLTDVPAVDGRIKMNIRGTSSQLFPKKGFGFHILEEDESNRKVSLLGMPQEHNWILHGPYSDKTLMRNAYSYSLSNDIGPYAPRTRFVELFMHKGSGPLREQHYHGVYVLTERIKIAPGRVEIEDLEPHHNELPEVSGGYIFKIDRLNPGETGFYTTRGTHYAFVRPNEQDITPAQRNYLIAYLDTLETALFDGDPNDTSSGYSDYLDTRSFIDMHLLTEITKEIDGYRLSTFFHKDRNGKLFSGPLWDFNLSLGNSYYLGGWNPQGWYNTQLSEYDYLQGWYKQLFRDDNFRRQYNRRYRSLRLTGFSNGNMLGKMMDYYNLLHEAQERNFELWDILGTNVWPNWFVGQTWDDEVYWMMDWVEARLAWMDSQLGEPYTMLHYWNFNDEANFLHPTYTLGDAQLEFTTAPLSEITTGSGQDFSGINARNGDNPASHLRVNDPLGAALIFHLPSTGYKDLLFSYESRRSGSGANRQIISYTTDGTVFSPFDTIFVTEKPGLYTFDFLGIEETHNNPDFAIKITFAFKEDGTGGLAGNNRIDNVTLDGEALPETQRPPVQTAWLPIAFKLIENGQEKPVNLNYYFKSPDGNALQYTLEAEQTKHVGLHLNNGQLAIDPQLRGGTRVNISVSDGENPPLDRSFYVLVYPEAANLTSQPNYTFNHWSPDEPAGSFPENMLFLQGTANEPNPGTNLIHAYHIPPDDYSADDQSNIGFPYGNTRRTRINGLGDNGISFINTGRERDLGAALLALNTQGAEQLHISWKASTIIPNSREYALRLQYRTGVNSNWKNIWNENGQMIEYQRGEAYGHMQLFQNIVLPEEALNQPYVQLRWLYYYTGRQNNPDNNSRDMLALNEVKIGSTVTQTNDISGANTTGLTVFPNPATGGKLNFNKTTSGALYDITGRKMAEVHNDNIISTSGLSNGIYIFRSILGESVRFIVAKP